MSMSDLFDQYASSHQNKWNVLCHTIGMPMIAFSLIYVIFVANSMIAWGIFALGWVLQFVGHAIEGQKPEFLSNPVFLIIGLLYFLKKLKNKFVGSPSPSQTSTQTQTQ